MCDVGSFLSWLGSPSVRKRFGAKNTGPALGMTARGDPNFCVAPEMRVMYIVLFEVWPLVPRTSSFAVVDEHRTPF